jgi:biotin carboxylase
VIRANSRQEFLTAVAQIRKLLSSPEIRAKREPNLGHLLVEEYIPGKEVAAEGLITEGHLQVLAIFDKPDPLEGPYFEETIYVTPSRLDPDVQKQIEKCMIDRVRALGLSHGPVHAEFRVNEEGVWPLEIAPRPIGGLCARALEFKLPQEKGPISLEELLLRHALGDSSVSAERESAASAVMMIPVPQSGMLQAVEGQESAQAVAGITELIITARLNDFIAAWPEGSSYLGFIFAKANSPEEAELAIRAAHAKLQFSITPRLPIEHPVTGKFHDAGS